MNYLESVEKEFARYKTLGERAMQQLADDQLFWKPSEDSNSIAILVNHMSGNMLSRFTDFLITDGEKEWRQRDREFEDVLQTREQITACWERGWNCLFNALGRLHPDDLARKVYIRNEGHTVVEAINRQIAHYSYHTGQITFLAKLLKGREWKPLSIPKGKSDEFNAKMFGK